MQPIVAALTQIAPVDDPEVVAGYQRYAEMLGAILTPEQIATYADMIQRTGAVRVFEDLAPEELAALTIDETAVATNIIADEDATMENRRVAALLSQRGQMRAVPDFARQTAPES